MRFLLEVEKKAVFSFSTDIPTTTKLNSIDTIDLSLKTMASECPHLADLSRLQPPRLSQSVHREECTQCFDDQVLSTPISKTSATDSDYRISPSE
jgi:hypothetical protein